MNMSIKNIILICLIFLSVLFGLIMMLVYIRRESILHKRGKINYSNYKEMKKHFNLSISNRVLMFGIVSILFVIVMCCFVIYNDALNIYLILLIATLILNVLGIYSYVSSTKYNRNLKEFDDYHNKVESSYANKGKIVNNLKIIDNKYQFVNGEIQKLYKKIDELVLGFTELPNIRECYEPLDKIKKEQEDILMSFDDKMPGIFTEVLIMYLKNGGQSSAQTYIFNPNIDLNIDSNLTIISNKLKDKYIHYIKDAFINRKHKDAVSLIEMINILNSYNLFEDKYVDILIDVVNSNPSANKLIIKYLFDKKHVNYKLISKCIEANRDWIFDYPITRLVTKNEFTTLVSEIIIKNSIILTNKLMSLIDRSSIENIKNGINIASTNNESSIVMNRYIELLELDGGFNSVSNRYENIALSLENYYKLTNTKNDKINKIINEDSFYENKEYLDETYRKVVSKLDHIFTKTFKTMLYFSLYGTKDFKYFSQPKINTIYVEYKRQLNVFGLLCLSSVLDGVILANTNKESVVKLINQNIDSLSGDSIYEKFYPNTGNKVHNTRLYGRDIIQNLFKNYKQELSTLINHIENERLVLDKIRYI